MSGVVSVAGNVFKLPRSLVEVKLQSDSQLLNEIVNTPIRCIIKLNNFYCVQILNRAVNTFLLAGKQNCLT